MLYRIISFLLFFSVNYCFCQIINSPLQFDSINDQEIKPDSNLVNYNFENENRVQLSLTSSGQYLRKEYNVEGQLFSITQIEILIFSDTLVTFPSQNLNQSIQQIDINQRLSYLRNGYYKEFKDGKDLLVFGAYLNGSKHGVWTYYKNNYQIEHIEIFNNGLLIESR